jgi:3',5'-cyclic AMP phosphodiesterase CpdA
VSRQLAAFATILLLLGLVAWTPLRADDPTAPPKHLRFVVYGDTRDGHEIHRKLVALIIKQKPDLVIQTGDLVHRGSEADLWKIYDEITGEMRKTIPVYPARGNHDVGGTGFEDRAKAKFTSGNLLFHSFEKGNCHFVTIDCMEPYAGESEQYTWLEKDLAAAQKASRLTFAYFHYPPYSIGSHGSDLRIRAALCPLMIKYGVRAVFNGHDHNYYRTKRDGVTYVVSGGGGAPLYPCDPAKGAIQGDKWESVNHIVVCDVDGDKLTVAALRADGSEIDRFTAAP